MTAGLRRPIPVALVLKSMSAIGSFAITVVIARLCGATIYGEYALAVQTSLTVATLALLGLDQVTVRTVAGDLREDRTDLARAALAQAARFVAVTSLVATAAMLLLAPWGMLLGMRSEIVMLSALALLSIPLLRIAVSGLRAAGRIVASQLVDGPVQTAFLAGLLLMAYLLRAKVGSHTVLVVYAVSLALTCVCGWLLLARVTRDWPQTDVRRHKSAAVVGWPIVLAVSTHMCTAWAVMVQIGAHVGLSDVGAFRVSMQIITISTMIITTVESIVNPLYAGDFRTARFDAARARHRRATLILIATAGPPVIVSLLFPVQLLRFFGPDFVVAATGLRVLAVAQAVNILTGPIGGMMVMAGRERSSLALAIIGLGLAVGITAWLGPVWGVTGAAIGYSAALIFRNLASYVLVFGATNMSRRARLTPQILDPITGGQDEPLV